MYAHTRVYAHIRIHTMSASLNPAHTHIIHVDPFTNAVSIVSIDEFGRTDATLNLPITHDSKTSHLLYMFFHNGGLYAAYIMDVYVSIYKYSNGHFRSVGVSVHLHDPGRVAITDHTEGESYELILCVCVGRILRPDSRGRLIFEANHAKRADTQPYTLLLTIYLDTMSIKVSRIPRTRQLNRQLYIFGESVYDHVPRPTYYDPTTDLHYIVEYGNDVDKNAIYVNGTPVVGLYIIKITTDFREHPAHEDGTLHSIALTYSRYIYVVVGSGRLYVMNTSIGHIIVYDIRTADIIRKYKFGPTQYNQWLCIAPITDSITMYGRYAKIVDAAGDEKVQYMLTYQNELVNSKNNVYMFSAIKKVREMATIIDMFIV